MLLDFSQIPVEPVANMRGGEGTVLLQKTTQGPVKVMRGVLPPGATIGLHPLDVRTLLEVFQTLIDNGGTVVVIEHDLDVIRSADYIIDMGPGGGEEGGRIVASGTPEEIVRAPGSCTGKYLRRNK